MKQISSHLMKVNLKKIVDFFQLCMQLTLTSISLAQIVALLVRCINPAVFNFYDVWVLFQYNLLYLYTKSCVSLNFIFRCRSFCIFDLFSCHSLFVYNCHAPSSHYSHEFFLNSHWLHFFVCLVEVLIINKIKIQ